MARRKPDRWPPHGIPISFSIRSPTGRSCRFCTSTVIRSQTRRSWRVLLGRNWNNCSAATGGTPYFVEGHEHGLMHETMASTLDAAVEQIQKIRQDARVQG